jgi:hypothetical protein
MSRKLIVALFAVGILGTVLIAPPAPAHETIAGQSPTPAVSSPVEIGTYGPYATIRRANEVANEFRSLGFTAIVFHDGIGYFVRVW